MIMIESSGRLFHIQAEKTRESGDFLGALLLIDKALVSYQKEGNDKDLVELLTSRFLVFKHLYQETKHKSYSILAKHSILAAIEIGESIGLTSVLSLSYFNLAQSYAELNDNHSDAIPMYEKAIKIMKEKPPEGHGGEGEVLNMENHLYFSQFKNGDESAFGRLEKATEKIMLMNDSPYERDVWGSGGYMKLAILSEGDGREEYLKKAQLVIDGNTDLLIRKKQLEELREILSEPTSK